MKELKTSIHSSNKRIAKNTIMLYIRHLLIMLVSLYTVRVVLKTLGVEDYGIYNVVGGVVALFSFFNSTMSSASQRFFSFAIGEGNFEKLRNTFAVNWIIYGIIAIAALILLETVGLWFVTTKLVIPPERVAPALWVYHFSVLTFLCSILTTPFMAMIIAHEDMNIYAYVSILEAILKLIIVFVLSYISVDKLQLYGVLIFLSTLISSGTYAIISKRKYKACQFRFLWDKTIFKEVFSFTGWSVFGSITVVIRNQAVTILLNQMFNPITVTARTIAIQVSNYVNVFAGNFNTGLYPAIVKNYAAKENEHLFSLMSNGSKITYFLMFVFGLPLFLEMPYVLNLWLENPPASTIIFTRLALVDTLITAMSLPLVTAVRATGKVKRYELTLGSILIVSFLVSWLVLYLGAEAYSVMIVAIVATTLMFIARLILLKRLIGFPIDTYVKKTLFPLFIVSLMAISFASFVKSFLPETFIYICICILSSIIFTTISMYFIVLNKEDRQKIRTIIISKLKRNNR